jgi:hypothetical protein
MHAFGNTLPRSRVTMGVDTVTTRFMKRVDDIMLLGGCDRTVATQKARQENEREFALFNLCERPAAVQGPLCINGGPRKLTSLKV